MLIFEKGRLLKSFWAHATFCTFVILTIYPSTYRFILLGVAGGLQPIPADFGWGRVTQNWKHI